MGHRQSLYFPVDMLEEIQHEATRQDRSLSWVVQQAWKVARSRLESIPTYDEPARAEPAREGQAWHEGKD